MEELINKAVSEAMAEAYRQGWDDCVLARPRPWWWKAIPAVVRDMLISDWVPAYAGTYIARIKAAIAGRGVR